MEYDGSGASRLVEPDVLDRLLFNAEPQDSHLSPEDTSSRLGLQLLVSSHIHSDAEEDIGCANRWR